MLWTTLTVIQFVQHYVGRNYNYENFKVILYISITITELLKQ